MHPILIIGKVGIGTTSPGAKLDVAGDIKSNGNTVWNAGNDGSGSGLDADTVDGMHSSDFTYWKDTIIVGSYDHPMFECPNGYYIVGIDYHNCNMYCDGDEGELHGIKCAKFGP